MNLFRFTLGSKHADIRLELVTTGIVMTRMNLVIQYFSTISAVSRETVSSASDVMSLLIVNDSFSRRLLFFAENLADGGGLFRGEVHHANFEGATVMSTLIFFPPRPFLFRFHENAVSKLL